VPGDPADLVHRQRGPAEPGTPLELPDAPLELPDALPILTASQPLVRERLRPAVRPPRAPGLLDEYQGPRPSWFARSFGYLAIVDVLIFVWGTCLAARIGPGMLALAIITVGLFGGAGLYGPKFTLSILDELPLIAGRTLMSATIISVVEIFRHHDLTEQTIVKLAAWFFVLTVAARAVVYAIVRRLRRHHQLQRRALIVGAGRVGVDIATRLHDYPEFGVKPVGFLDNEPLTPLHLLPVPLLGSQATLSAVIESTKVDAVIIAFGHVREAGLLELIRTCQRLRCEIYVVPRFYEMQSQSRTDHVWGVPLVRLHRAIYRSITWRLKRVFDVGMAAIAITITAPILLFCALAVRREGRDIFFRQQRVGVDGRAITILKFRSLKPVDENESATTWNISHDDRLTATGRFLRKTSLDELPQLWSILRGDMSLVGPRPERPHFVTEFSNSYAGYGNRHRVPAGLTGWAQVHGLRGDTSIEDRARFDNYYIENWSLWLDVKILIRTCAAVLHGTGS
jgi:exopolysaccharide biosynthesis polyprenyl glycosylphosphotransferase